MLHLKRCFNVETLTIVQRWKYVASSTLFQRWNTDERSTLKICCIFNVVSTLKKRRGCNVEISTLNQRWIIVVQRCNLYSTNFQRWNNVACLLGYHTIVVGSLKRWRDDAMTMKQWNDSAIALLQWHDGISQLNDVDEAMIFRGIVIASSHHRAIEFLLMCYLKRITTGSHCSLQLLWFIYN